MDKDKISMASEGIKRVIEENNLDEKEIVEILKLLTENYISAISYRNPPSNYRRKDCEDFHKMHGQLIRSGKVLHRKHKI